MFIGKAVLGCTRYMEPDDDPGSCAAIDAWLGLPAGSVEEAWMEAPQQSGRSERSELRLMGSSRLTWYGLTHPPTCASPPA